MEHNQIWLKPKPSHIDENFEDFLQYLKSSSQITDDLHTESIRLLRTRVGNLVGERTEAPVYRQCKEHASLTFNTRLCGAWLLAIDDAGKDERKQVMLTMLNNLIPIAARSAVTGLNTTFAYKSVPTLLEMAIRLVTHDLPTSMPFAWNDLISFKLDLFVGKVIGMTLTPAADCYYEGHGLLIAKKGETTIGSYPKESYDKKYLRKDQSDTRLLPEYGYTISTERTSTIKESQKDDISVIEEFVNDLLARMNAVGQNTTVKRKLNYNDNDYVPVEVTSVSNHRILLKTIDPSYNEIQGQLVLEQNLKLFSKIYPLDVWAKVLREGDRFNANVNTASSTFSITSLFIDYIRDMVSIGKSYDAHNRIVEGQLKLREFWTDEGYMVFVNLTEEEDEELKEHNGYAGVEITEFGDKGFRGCIYGRICDYNVEKKDFNRDDACMQLLQDFIDDNSEIKFLRQDDNYDTIPATLLKEHITTLNLLQSRETNPILRYRILSVMRIVCTLIADTENGGYSQYIARYIKTLILFAQADSNEGETVAVITAPDNLEDEETVANGTDILRILACFAKDYDTTSEVLDPYIESDNETLSKTASLVQSYNRLLGMLEGKTLRGIKKQILNQLSVVTDGDSNLELSNELEGIYGEEDDMKEFKTSFFEAPKNAKEQRQYHNIFRGICAMMNNRGGVMYLGVNDKGIPVGVKGDLDHLSKQNHQAATLDAYMLHISRMGEEWFGETQWKYVTMRPISEHNVVSIIIEPYPYDIVYLKDDTTYLRKNNASAPITDQSTIDDIRRHRVENLRKTDDKTIILRDAIQKELKVRLKGYKSSNSGTIGNRVVEAFKIEGNEYIHAYEPESDRVKVFRISRADSITMTNEPWESKAKHIAQEMDPFHMTGTTKITVKLRLRLQAKNAIEETYPGIAQFIRQDSNESWTLDTFTYSLTPLMTFYLSHAEHIDIIDAKGLREATVAYVKNTLHIG